MKLRNTAISLPLPALAHPSRLLAITGVVALALGMAMFLPTYTLVDGYDWQLMHVFYKDYYRTAILEGSLPLWNPYSGLGRPFLADIETATLYIPNLFYLAGVGTGLFANLTVHFFLAVWGGITFAGRVGCNIAGAWLSALAFACSAPLIGRLQGGQLQVFCTLCWLPLLMTLACAVVERRGTRDIVKFSAALAMMFLAGNPPVFWVCAWAVALLAIMRDGRPKSIGALAAGALLALGLVAIQALPFLELVLQGNRSLEAPAFALDNPEKGKNWLSLFASKPSGRFPYWEYNLYAGFAIALGMVMSVALVRCRNVRILLLLGGFFALLALGSATPVLPWLVDNIPGWGALRVPARYAIIVTFAATTLAGIAGTRVVLAIVARRPKTGSVAAAALAVIGALNALDCLRAMNERAAIYAGPAWPLQETNIAKALHGRSLIDGTLPPPRVASPHNMVRENSGVLHHYSTIASYSNPALARTWDYIHTAAGAETNPADPINAAPAVARATADQLKATSIALYWENDQNRFVLKREVEPRAFVSHAVEIVEGGWQEANRRVAEGFDIYRTSLVERAFADHVAKLPPRTNSEPLRIADITFKPETISLRVATPDAGIVTLAESWYPGWEARVDGNPAPLIAVNGWMRGVVVPAGTHDITMKFRPRTLWWGCLITVLACGLAVLLWIRNPGIHAHAS